MDRIERFRERSLHTLKRRVGVALRRYVMNRFVRVKRVAVVEMAGRSYKRVTLPTATLASRVARNLRAFRDHDIFPRLVAEFDDELLLEFVEGRVVETIDAKLVDRLAGFFARVYAVGARLEPLEKTRFRSELSIDLEFLHDVGVLDEPLWRDLVAGADSLAPAEVWVGYDYIDPLPRNFVVTPQGRFVAVDAEELLDEQLVGGGVAKALLRFLQPQRERFLDALARESSLDLRPILPFVELCWLAGWTKWAFLKGREELVDPASFEPYRAGASNSRPASSR